LSVITLLGVILTAMVFVKEKEDGTWDIMLLMPVDSKLIIFAKIISQVIILLGGVIIAFGFVIFGAFNAPMNGSIFDFLILALLYSITSAGIGLFIAAISESALEVGQYAMLIMMPFIFLSGAWTPIYAMHPALQFLSLFSPLRYYIEGSESIMLRGADMLHLWQFYAALLFLGIILFWYGYRKMGRLF
jgi:ABC-2 type transport system permease protein